MEATGTFTFAPGETSKTLSVTVNGDTTFEPDETFLLRPHRPAVNGAIASNDGVGTITNDDPEPPLVSVTAISPNVIGQFAAPQTVTVSGGGFDPTSSISFSKPGVTKVAGTEVYVDENTLRVNIQTSASIPVGPTDVTVTGANGSATCAGCLTIAPRPVVTGTTPTSLGGGATVP